MKFIATTIIINIISCTHLHLAINWWKYYFLRIKYDFSPSLNRNHKKSRLKLVDTHTHRPLIYEIFFVNFHFDNLSIFIIKDFVINFVFSIPFWIIRSSIYVYVVWVSSFRLSTSLTSTGFFLYLNVCVFVRWKVNTIIVVPF